MQRFYDKIGEALSGANKKVQAAENADIVAFVRERLGFDPDAKQGNGFARRAAGDRELYAAMGEVDRDGG